MGNEVLLHNNVTRLSLIIRKHDKVARFSIESGPKLPLHEAKLWAQNTQAIKIDATEKDNVERIIRNAHDLPTSGHPGIKATIELIQRHFTWPNMNKDITAYVNACVWCQQTKPNHNWCNAPLHPILEARFPFDVISIDLIGPLPDSKGYDSILIIVDYYMKMKILIPTTTHVTAKGVAIIFLTNIFNRFGAPQKVISDHGPQFVSNFMKEFYDMLKITGAPSTAYHPQTDGQTEWANQEVEQYLWLFTNFQQNDWSDWLPIAKFSLNSRTHASMKNTPFYMMHGFHPNAGIPGLPQVDSNPSTIDYIDNLCKACTNAEIALKKSADIMKKYYDRTRGQSWAYNIGDKVWLEGMNITTLRPMKKLGDKQYGPFKILEKVGPSSYRLRLPNSWSRVHSVFNEVLLLPYCKPTFNNQELLALPIAVRVDESQEYEVESIIASRKKWGWIEFLVYWKGWSDDDDTWEPRWNLMNATQVINDFYNANPDTPR